MIKSFLAQTKFYVSFILSEITLVLINIILYTIFSIINGNKTFNDKSLNKIDVLNFQRF